MQMKCKCNANEMKCDQMQNKCIILGMIHYNVTVEWEDGSIMHEPLNILVMMPQKYMQSIDRKCPTG